MMHTICCTAWCCWNAKMCMCKVYASLMYEALFPLCDRVWSFMIIICRSIHFFAYCDSINCFAFGEFKIALGALR